MAGISNTVTTKEEEFPTKVILWCLPRTLSTLFAKCMSNIGNSVIYSEVFKDAHYNSIEMPKQHYVNKEKASRLITDGRFRNAIPDETITFQWLKDTFESDFEGKRMVFCKDLAYSVYDHFDILPLGVRHTFLIRDPYKLYPKRKKLAMRYILTLVLALPSEISRTRLHIQSTCTEKCGNYTSTFAITSNRTRWSLMPTISKIIHFQYSNSTVLISMFLSLRISFN